MWKSAYKSTLFTFNVKKQIKYYKKQIKYYKKQIKFYKKQIKLGNEDYILAKKVK